MSLLFPYLKKKTHCPLSHPHSDLCQRLEEVGLVPERVVDQAIAKGDNAMREVVLRQPGHYPLLLHVWPSGHVDDQIA